MLYQGNVCIFMLRFYIQLEKFQGLDGLSKRYILDEQSITMKKVLHKKQTMYFRLFLELQYSMI